MWGWEEAWRFPRTVSLLLWAIREFIYLDGDKE
jgi:hypothetical protein